jgi:solute carrier family 25 oxoglutarate transporter 11
MSLASSSGNAAAGDNFFAFSRKIVQQKGFFSLYNGLSAGITRQIFYASSRFGLFEVFRDELAKYRPTDIWSRLLAGCVSGAAAAFISCPAEVSLVRISNDNTLPADQRRNYKGVFDAFRRIAAEEGPKAFFAGSGPFVNRAILVGAVQVGTYDQLRESYRKVGVTGNYPNVFCASMTAGLLYACVTMPFETAKNRMAFQKPDKVTGQMLYRSSFGTISTVAKMDGVFALWNGFLPYYLRCGGHTVSMFIFVEWVRRAYVKSIEK